MNSWRILIGDVREQLSTLPAGSVRTCVTSPPYWGLRDYGVAGQLGLEATPEAYCAEMVAVFADVRRVLSDDGTLWLNLGDSYAGSRGGPNGDGTTGRHETLIRGKRGGSRWGGGDNAAPGCKTKDLVGIPWMVAFALRADGWYLRSDIIWSKPNPMPESVTDRPTKAHEMIFLLSKSARYFYDADAIREGVSEPRIVAGSYGYRDSATLSNYLGLERASAASLLQVGIRLAASVLNIAQRQDEFGLLALDSQVRHEGTNGSASLSVVHIPVVRRAASQASRFTDGDVSAKEFLQEMDRICVALPDGDDLKETWRLASLDIGHIDANRDRSIAVNNTGEVGEFQLGHGSNYTARVPSSRARVTGRGINKEAEKQAPGRQPQRSNSGGFPPRDKQRGHGRRHAGFNDRWDGMERAEQVSGGANKRSVWNVATSPYPDAHFATFPEKLIEPCILAGSAVGDTVLDPFTGSGTTGAVAIRHQRNFIGCELNPAYVELARKRIGSVAPMFAQEVA